MSCPAPRLRVHFLLLRKLECAYTFLYHATDFDTFTMSCRIISLITVWISMCTASKRHVTLHFVSPAKKSLAAVVEVTDILKVFSNHVCRNTQAMPNFSGYEPPLCHSSDT